MVQCSSALKYGPSIISISTPTFQTLLCLHSLSLSLKSQQQQNHMAAPPSPVHVADSSDSNPIPNINRSLPPELRIVNIHFVSQVHKTLTFKVKGHLPLQQVVEQYFNRSSLSRGVVDLLYKGHRLNLHSTPNQLGMKNDVKIDVMVLADGGGMKLQYLSRE